MFLPDWWLVFAKFAFCCVSLSAGRETKEHKCAEAFIILLTGTH